MRHLAAPILALAALSVLPSGADAQIPEMEGLWVMNPELNIGPGPVWETLDFVITETEQRYVMQARNDAGVESRTEWEVRYDGRDHSTGPNTTTSIRQIGAKVEVVTNKADGEVTGTYTRVLVDDDRTLMSIGRDSRGRVTWVRVFERQD